MTKFSSHFQWTKFASLASQWAIALIVLIYVGKFIDGKYLSDGVRPIFIWLLPFLFIILSLYRIIKETKSTSNDIE